MMFQIDLSRVRHDLAETVTVVDVTPEMAEKWLVHNTHNRSRKIRSIERFAADMKNGTWQWNGSSICFAADGTLLDGQNRLYAVVESGATVPFVIVTGLQMVAQNDIDTGLSRKFSDILQLNGESNSTTLAGIVRTCLGWNTGLRSSVFNTTSTGSIAAGLAFLDSHPELRWVAEFAKTSAGSSGVTPVMFGTAYWVTSAIDPEDAADFFSRFSDGQALVKGHPVYELRRTLTERGQRSNTNLNRIWTLAVIIKAWNSYRDGEEVSLYRWSPGGSRPEKFPEPK